MRMKSHWLTKKLGEIVKKVDLKKAPIGSWPYIEIGDIDIENKNIILKDKKSINGAVIAPADSVLVSRVRPTRGAIVLINKSYAVSPAFTILKAKSSETLSKFLFYWLSSSRDFLTYLQRKQKGSNYPSVREKDILNYKIVLPPLPIQQKIVERLDAIKKAQELNDKQIALAEELKKSFIYRLESQLKQWQRVPLAQCVDSFQLGLIKSKKDYSEGGVPYLKMDAIQTNGEIDFTKVIKVNASEEEIQEYRLYPGDFLFNTRNTKELVGKSAVFDEGGIYLFNNNILRLRFKNILPLFLNAFFHTTQGKRLLNSKKKGTTSVWAIYQKDLFKIKIPLPSLETQKKIVEKLSAVQEYKKKLLKQKQLLQELFESVLNKSFKGEI